MKVDRRGMTPVAAIRESIATPRPSTETRMPSVLSLAQAFFALIMIGLGILGLITGDFTPIWTGAPQGVPARQALAYLCALLSLVTGMGLLWRRTAVVASRVLLTSFLIWWLVFRVPAVVLASISSGAWWVWGDSAVMMAGAWALYAWLARDRSPQRLDFATGDRGLRIARVLYGLGLIPFGIAHFTFLKRTVSLVPGWLPWHLAWAEFTGGAFIVAGIAIVIGVCARLAAALSTLQMFLFTVLVWIPIVLGTPKPFDWTEFVSSWTLTAAACVVAGSYRGATPARSPAP
jgi:uncharacterized membrane protein